MNQRANNLAAYIWSLADLLRGDFKQSQYGRIILPFTLLRRLEGVLEQTKAAVLVEHEKIQKLNLPEEAEEKLLLRATNGLSFFNTSKMDLSKLGESGIKDNLESYIQGFSKDGRQIFEHFNFAEFIGQLNDANLLYKVIQKVRKTDLSPKAVSNYEMGLVFEELIRRYILEADLLETIVALPTDMFYNTGISTYVWVLSNKKSQKRKGKVQLINGVHLCGKMRKSLGSKRNVMDDDDIATITRCAGNFEAIDARELDKPLEQKSNRGRQSENSKAAAPKIFASKIFNHHEFGYRRITIERPLRESWQFSDERIGKLRFAPKPLNAAMKWIYAEYGQEWTDQGCQAYGVLKKHEADIRKAIKTDFKALKEKQIKTLLDSKTWLTQRDILLKARELQQAIGREQHDDMNGYDAAVKATGVKLDAKEKKQIIAALSWKNPDAKKVIKKIHKKVKADPVYGLFKKNDKLVEYKPNGDLRDFENVPLDPSKSVNEINEAYFAKEVLPHVPEAWINADKRDAIDQEIGIVGYEIPFNRHFYVYQPPRDLAEIDADLEAVSAEIMDLLREVHG